MLFARIDEASAPFPARSSPDERPAPPAAAVEKAIGWLRAAERPAILAGGGAWFSGAERELLAFAERTGIPVFSNGKAHGMVPADHPLCGRGFATLLVAATMGAPADVVLVLGARLGLFTGGGRGAPLLPRGAKIIQVDVAAEEIGRNRDVDLGIAADCRETLRAFEAAAGRDVAGAQGLARHRAGGARPTPRAVRGGARSRRRRRSIRSGSRPTIAKMLPRDAIVAADGGETASWMEMAAELRGGGRWMSHGYLGCLGTGMPFAIAAKVAHPDAPVLCIVGDGSVGLNFAEFDTMVRHRLPIVTVVNNDQQWGMSAHGQELLYGKDRKVVTELAPTRYDLAAAGFGCHAEHVVEPRDLMPRPRARLRERPPRLRQRDDRP